MDRGAWWATVHGVAKELDITLATKQQQQLNSNLLSCSYGGYCLIQISLSHEEESLYSVSKNTERLLNMQLGMPD